MVKLVRVKLHKFRSFYMRLGKLRVVPSLEIIYGANTLEKIYGANVNLVMANMD